MRRRMTTMLLATAIATTLLAAPASAQLAGFTTLEPEVIDQGDQPRVELRYLFSQGQRDTMAMNMTMEMVNTMDGAPLVDLTMIMETELETLVTDVYDDGSARVEQVFTRYEFAETGDPAADAELLAVSEQFVGLAMWSVIDDRGTVLDFGVADDTTLAPEIVAQLRDTSGTATILPEEPVGVGAKWVADGTILSQGVPLEMSIETEMAELTADGIVLDVTMAGAADMASALVGELPPEVDISVGRFAMVGGGRSAIEFDSLVPTSDAGIDLEMEMSISAGEGDQTFEASMGFVMLMGLESYPVE